MTKCDRDSVCTSGSGEEAEITQDSVRASLMERIPVGDCEVRTKTCQNTDLADGAVTCPGT